MAVRSNWNRLFRLTNAGGKRAANITVDMVEDGDSFSGLDNITIGTSSTAESHTSESSKALAGYVTCSATSGSTSYEPWYFYTTLTGAGQVGGRLKSHTYSNVASGGWVNAIKGHMEFGASGSTSGLASAVVAEMTAPNATVGGAYFPMEIEMIYGASTSPQTAGLIYANITGTATNFDSNAYFFWLNSLTAGAGKMLSAQSQTLKCRVGAATDRYVVLSTAENCLTIGDGVTTGVQIGNATTGILLDGNFTDGLKIATSNTVTDAIEIASGTNAINVSGTGSSSGYGLKLADGYTGMGIKIGSLSSSTPGTGLEVSATVPRAVDVHADDNNSAIASAVTTSAIRGRLMAYASVQAELWGIHGLSKIKDLARTANVAAGVSGAFESTGTCSTATGSGNTYCAGVMGRVGTGGGFTIGAGTYVACVLAFGNNANSNAFTGTGYHGFHVALTDVGTPETLDVGMFIEDSATTTGIDIGNATTGINMGTYSGSGIVLEGSLMGVDLTTTITGSSAINANEFNVTDSTTASSGYARGIWLNMTAGGTKTGTAETNGVGIDLTVTGNSPFARALTLYTNATGTPTIGTMNALDIYMDDEACGVTQTGKRAINIGIDHGNDKGTCDMIVFRCHGGTVDNVLKFTDTTGSPYTNFLSIDGICGFVSAETGATFAGDGVKIKIDVGGSTYYLRACTAFS